jgi:hypothetical protein
MAAKSKGGKKAKGAKKAAGFQPSNAAAQPGDPQTSAAPPEQPGALAAAKEANRKAVEPFPMPDVEIFSGMPLMRIDLDEWRQHRLPSRATEEATLTVRAPSTLGGLRAAAPPRLPALPPPPPPPALTRGSGLLTPHPPASRSRAPCAGRARSDR